MLLRLGGCLVLPGFALFGRFRACSVTVGGGGWHGVWRLTQWRGAAAAAASAHSVDDGVSHADSIRRPGRENIARMGDQIAVLPATAAASGVRGCLPPRPGSAHQRAQARARRARTGRALGNPVLQTEGRVTLIDGILATAVLAGLVLNAALGWWADPVTGYVLVFYAAREVREIFFKLA
jgi:hypothetical protein